MARKLILVAMALIIPGGFIALAIAWVSQRPMVKARILIIWRRVRGGARRAVAVPTLALARVPVSQSRCNDTQLLPALRPYA